MSNVSASPSVPWRSFLSLALMVPMPLYLVLEVLLHFPIVLGIGFLPVSLGLPLSIASVVVGYRARAYDPRPFVRLALITGWISLCINLIPILVVIIFVVALSLGLIHVGPYIH